MPIYQLNIEADEDFELTGISSHQKDYRLAWAINRQMEWRLVRQTDFETKRNEQLSAFAQFTFVLPLEQTLFTLIANKSENGMLMPELPQFDYLLKAENNPQPLDDVFYKKLKSTLFINAAFPLPVDKLKNKHVLIGQG
ncbi:MAG: IPExxxVDY family protein [Flavobacteriales bacterium]